MRNEVDELLRAEARRMEALRRELRREARKSFIGIGVLFAAAIALNIWFGGL